MEIFVDFVHEVGACNSYTLLSDATIEGCAPAQCFTHQVTLPTCAIVANFASAHDNIGQLWQQLCAS